MAQRDQDTGGTRVNDPVSIGTGFGGANAPEIPPLVDPSPSAPAPRNDVLTGDAAGVSQPLPFRHDEPGSASHLLRGNGQEEQLP